MADVYASPDELAAITGTAKGADERLEIALIMGSRMVDLICGYAMSAYPDQTQPVPQDAITHPVTVTEVPVPPGAHQAALVFAARYLRSPDVPLGFAGGLGDYAVRIRSEVPEAEMHLVGLRADWGIG